MSNIDELTALVCEITSVIKDREVNKDLEEFLTITFASGNPIFDDLSQLCRQGMIDGWLGKHDVGGLRYGRVIKPTKVTDGFSVDVVLMKDTNGPYHIHPMGEIDMVIPIDETATFDGQGLGWKVYSSGSGHYPTVKGGEAIILYLLPNGSIEFIKPV